MDPDVAVPGPNAGLCRTPDSEWPHTVGLRCTFVEPHGIDIYIGNIRQLYLHIVTIDNYSVATLGTTVATGHNVHNTKHS